MSGVNAHLLLQASCIHLSAEHAGSQDWQRTRLYALPRQFTMCSSYVSPSKQHTRFCCQTALAGLSWLWEVAAGGRQTLSPTAAFECATSAVRQCFEESSFCLSHLTLAAAPELPEVVYTDLNLRTGELHLESETAGGILSCLASSSPITAPASQPSASSSTLHSSLPSGRRAASSSLADFTSSGAFTINPGHSAAVLHLSMLDSPMGRMICQIQTIFVPEPLQETSRQAAFSTDSSAALLSPAGHRVCLRTFSIRRYRKEQ